MIRAGFIGVGGISKVHLDYLKKRKNVRIVALCDTRPEQAEKQRQVYGGTTFTDFRKMLATTPLDAVWLCTPPAIRKEPLLACAARGLPVLCEKPVENSATRARAIATALARRRAKVQIGYVFRYTPVIAALRQAMQDDSIHLVQSFYGCGVSLTMGLPAWFYDKQKSGGALVDQATHNLDLLRFLFGEVRAVHGLAANPVRKKTARYTIDETLSLMFRFRNGMLGTHNHTWVGDGWRNEIVFSGEKRFYRLNLSKGRLTVEGAPIRSKPKTALMPKADATGQVCFQADGTSIYQYENDIFLKQIQSGNWRTNPSTYADGAKTLQLTLACDRAITSRKVVNLA